MTSEARKHLITKSAVSYRVTLKTFSMVTGEAGEMTAEISGNFSTESEMLGAVAVRYTTTEEAVVPVLVKPIEKVEDRRAMFDDDFFRYGHILKDGEKICDSMIRTLTLCHIKCLSADFENQTFSDEMITVIGDFDNAEEAVSWHKKRTPNDSKIYGKFSSMEKAEIKVALPVADFFAHSFSVNNNE